MLTAGLFLPYRGVRYHLNEYTMHAPEHAKKFSTSIPLQNASERAFGVLKKRFSIIAGGVQQQCPFETQIEIVLASCIVHNYLMGADPDETVLLKLIMSYLMNCINN